MVKLYSGIISHSRLYGVCRYYSRICVVKKHTLVTSAAKPIILVYEGQRIGKPIRAGAYLILGMSWVEFLLLGVNPVISLGLRPSYRNIIRYVKILARCARVMDSR